MNRLNVCEIFESIDGEANGWRGPGEWTTFIRLQGCNLSCTYCDTNYATEIKNPNARMLTVDEIVSFVPVDKKVTITGGEPLLQPYLWELIDRLCIRGQRITIETNGTMYIPKVYFSIKNVRFVVDWKLGSSRPSRSPINTTNYDALRKIDIIKFVVFDQEDYEEAKEVANLYYNHWKCHWVLALGWKMHGVFPNRPELIELILKEADPRFQLQLQLHKVIQEIWKVQVR